MVFLTVWNIVWGRHWGSSDGEPSDLSDVLDWSKFAIEFLGQILNVFWGRCVEYAKIDVCNEDATLRHGWFSKTFFIFSWHCTVSTTTLTNPAEFHSTTTAPVLCKLCLWSYDRLLLQFNYWVVLWCKYSGNLPFIKSTLLIIVELMCETSTSIILPSTTNFLSPFLVKVGQVLLLNSWAGNNVFAAVFLHIQGSIEGGKKSHIKHAFNVKFISDIVGFFFFLSITYWRSANQVLLHTLFASYM